MKKTPCKSVQYNMKNKWISKDQQPRERLLRIGPAVLSDLELVTAIIGSGTPRTPAVAAAGQLLSRCDGDLHRLFSVHSGELRRIDGFGEAKYCALIAGMELGRRMVTRPGEERTVIRSPDDAFDALREYLPPGGWESIVALCLDNRNRILAIEEIASSHLPAGSDLDLRKLLRMSLNMNASGVILAHNHPSGEADPSQEDIRMSRRLADILGALGIDLIDHLVITGHSYRRINWEHLRAG